MSKKEIQALLANKDAFEAAAKKGYEEVDVNKNGLIDFEEVEAILANFAKGNNLPKPTKSEVEAVYTKLDKDKSGKVDFEAFKVFFKSFLIFALKSEYS